MIGRRIRIGSARSETERKDDASPSEVSERVRPWRGVTAKRPSSSPGMTDEDVTMTSSESSVEMLRLLARLEFTTKLPAAETSLSGCGADSVPIDPAALLSMLDVAVADDSDIETNAAAFEARRRDILVVSATRLRRLLPCPPPS